jgi:tetratricopeptide (TPR) repeat protein
MVSYRGSVLAVCLGVVALVAASERPGAAGERWGRYRKHCSHVYALCHTVAGAREQTCERIAPCMSANDSSSAPIRILVGRPSNFTYNSFDAKSAWAAGLFEEFLRFKLGGVNRISTIESDYVTDLIPAYREFDKRVSTGAYLDAGEKLDATHVIFTEYMRTSANMVDFYIRVIPVSNEKETVRITEQVNVTDLNVDFNRCAEKIAAALSLNDHEYSPALAALPLLSRSPRLNKKIGELILQCAMDKNKLKSRARSLGRIARRHPLVYCAAYAGARYLARADEYYAAAKVTRSLEKKLAGHMPALTLLAASRFRKAHMYDRAARHIDRIEEPGLRSSAAIEKSQLFRATGNMAAERTQYEIISAMRFIDPYVFVQRARLAVIMGRIDDALRYAEVAAALVGEIPKKIMIHIGDNLVADDQMRYAVDAYAGATALPPHDQTGWRELATAQERLHRDSAAAMSWLNLFHSNNYLYQDALQRADSLLRNAGMTYRARQLYTNYLENYPGNPMVSIQLAQLEFESGNFAEALALLEIIGAPWRGDPAVRELISACSRRLESPEELWVSYTPSALERLWESLHGIFHAPPAADTYLDYAKATDTSAARYESPAAPPATENPSISRAATDSVTRPRRFADPKRPRAARDATPPVITLFGGGHTTIRVNEPFEEPGANAIDNIDGDITHLLRINGRIDTSTVGAYTVTYWVIDSAGNMAFKTWTVRVLPARDQQFDPLASR